MPEQLLPSCQRRPKILPSLEVSGRSVGSELSDDKNTKNTEILEMKYEV
jgi:hypothetical protein